MARDGWRVAASARRADELAKLAREAGGLPGTIHAYPLDVTDQAAVWETVAAIELELGAIDVAVLNAGTHEPTPAATFAAATLRRLLEINVIGVANGLEAVLPRLIARGAAAWPSLPPSRLQRPAQRGGVWRHQGRAHQSGRGDAPGTAATGA